jgi:hypothetical protein
VYHQAEYSVIQAGSQLVDSESLRKSRLKKASGNKSLEEMKGENIRVVRISGAPICIQGFVGGKRLEKEAVLQSKVSVSDDSDSRRIRQSYGKRTTVVTRNETHFGRTAFSFVVLLTFGRRDA